MTSSGDPNDENVIASARANGISDEMIESARKSLPCTSTSFNGNPALPLHIEYRTMPMLLCAASYP
ncbi:MAG: hypothetical protein IPH10_11235 [bacterium]|nr:hypothetical protein [bacterium]